MHSEAEPEKVRIDSEELTDVRRQLGRQFVDSATDTQRRVTVMRAMMDAAAYLAIKTGAVEPTLNFLSALSDARMAQNALKEMREGGGEEAALREEVKSDGDQKKYELEMKAGDTASAIMELLNVRYPGGANGYEIMFTLSLLFAFCCQDDPAAWKHSYGLLEKMQARVMEASVAKKAAVH